MHNRLKAQLQERDQRITVMENALKALRYMLGAMDGGNTTDMLKLIDKVLGIEKSVDWGEVGR